VRPGTKLAALVMALRRPQGATSLQLMLATGWQPHTLRGAISGMLRKKLGLTVVLAHNDSRTSQHANPADARHHADPGMG